jgi:ferredoxin
MATVGEVVVLDREGLAALVATLRADGRTVVGPTVRDGAIVVAEIRSLGDLPEGWTDRHEAGRYRLERRNDRALFGYVVGPQSFKASFFVPRKVLLRARRKDGSFVILGQDQTVPRLALLGARSCDLAAIGVQDRVFQDDAFVDADYAARRRDVFVVAVQCGQAGGTCFCVSMGTGPRATNGFDLALTELLDGAQRFVLEVGSEAGAGVVARLPHRPATPDDRAAADRAVAQAAAQMGRTMDPAGLKELLYANLEHPRWDEVATRCLSCTNCTMVCPTCFCATIEDTTDLSGDEAERARRWDSCFTVGHSWVHGGAVHASIRSRYRQWLTHKLASWIDQFGTSGCVGCGRCITWCPAGIDLTEEVAALRVRPSRTEV